MPASLLHERPHENDRRQDRERAEGPPEVAGHAGVTVTAPSADFQVETSVAPVEMNPPTV
jgi:hypothetical protein